MRTSGAEALRLKDGGLNRNADNKKGRRYRYYVTHSLIKRGRPKASDTARRVSAGDVELLVEERIVSFLQDEGELHRALAETTSQAHEIETLINAASSLAARWPRMAMVEKRQWLQGLIARVTLNPEGLESGSAPPAWAISCDAARRLVPDQQPPYPTSRSWF